MDLLELERLVELVQKANVGELTLRQGPSRLTIRKTRPKSAMSSETALVPYRVERDGYAEEEEPFEMEVEYTPTAPEATATVVVTAPLVGVFRHVKPVIGLGAKVTQGQVIGGIEAMKFLNEVTSPVDGAVLDVQVEDALPVEYGQTLFVLQPDPHSDPDTA